MFFGTLHKEMDSPSALYFTGMGGSLLLSLKIGTDYGFWIAGLIAFRLAWDIFNRYLDVDYGTTCYGFLKGIKYAVYIWFSWRLVSIDIVASLLPVTIIIFSMYFIAVWVFDMRKFNKLVAFTWMLTDIIIIWRML
jgi:hypothetical protein